MLPAEVEVTHFYGSVAGPAHDEPERVWGRVHGGTAGGPGH